MPKTLFRTNTTKFMYFEKPEGSGRNLLVVKNARLYRHDFKGERSNWGTRSVCVEIPEEIKDLLTEDEWEIKASIPQDESRPVTYYLPVKIQFNDYGPNIVKTSPDSPVTYDEDIVGELDGIDMTNIDIVIRPYRKDNTKPTVTAYLNEMRFKMNKSPIDCLYDNDEEDENLPFI